jgi:hypothetical protein
MHVASKPDIQDGGALITAHLIAGAFWQNVHLNDKVDF